MVLIAKQDSNTQQPEDLLAPQAEMFEPGQAPTAEHVLPKKQGESDVAPVIQLGEVVHHSRPEEVTLEEMIRRCWNRKIPIMGFVLSVMIMAAMWLFSMPDKYKFMAVIEIGRGVDGQLIEKPSDVKQKIVNAYVPSLFREMSKQNTGSPSLQSWGFGVELPDETNVVVLSTNGALEQEGEHFDFLQHLIRSIEESHSDKMESQRNALRMKVAEAERLKAAAYDAERRLLRQKQIILSEESELESRLEILRKEIKDREAAKEKAVTVAKEKSDLLILLMLDRDLQHRRDEVSDVSRRLAVDMPTKIAGLDKEIADVQRDKKEQEDHVESNKLKMEALVPTGAVRQPQRSVGKVGPRRGHVLLAVLVVCSVLAACVAVLVPRRG